MDREMIRRTPNCLRSAVVMILASRESLPNAHTAHSISSSFRSTSAFSSTLFRARARSTSGAISSTAFTSWSMARTENPRQVRERATFFPNWPRPITTARRFIDDLPPSASQSARPVTGALTALAQAPEKAEAPISPPESPPRADGSADEHGR